MSKTTKIMDIMGKYEAVLKRGAGKQTVCLYYKWTDFDQEGWRHDHRKLIGKYSNLQAVLADIMDSMNNGTFWHGNWKGA